MFKSKILFLSVAAYSLAGCIGGGSDEAEVSSSALAAEFTRAVSNQGAYGERGVAAAAQIQRLQNLPVTNGANLPQSGSATYSGQLGLGTTESGALGDLELTATFAGTGGLDGSVSNFVNAAGEPIPGALTISGGSIDATVDPEEQWQVNANISGTVARTGASNTVDGILQGEFVGANGEGIVGEVRELTTDGSVTSSTVTGFFGASRN